MPDKKGKHVHNFQVGTPICHIVIETISCTYCRPPPQSAYPKIVFGKSKRGLTNGGLSRRRTNVQQLTCNINLSSCSYYLLFSFVLIELKPFVLKGKVLGKNSEKVWKILKNYETILPFSCCPSAFPWKAPTQKSCLENPNGVSQTRA